MFISVEFGYKQRRLFNIECQTASLIDAINENCYSDMSAFLKKQTDIFTKELNQWKKESNNLKKLKNDEEKPEDASPEDPQKQTPSKRGGRTQVKVRTKPEHPSKRPKKTKETEEEKK
jgi:hypothetical protein